MTPEDFAKATFGAIAKNGMADGGGGSDKAGAADLIGFGRVGALAVEAPKREGTAVKAAAFFTDGSKITLAAKVLLRAKTHGGKKPE